MSPRVLVVTDDAGVREEVSFGYPEDVEVTVASDSREAIELMRSLMPDVVVMEIRTGSAGGFALAREMRQSKKLEHVPILMLLERAQDEWLARQAGAQATRIQPLETSDLVTETLSLLPAPAA
jgi:chemosensory pili system protein ChpA (sensor histidine kinase/response regulator)